MKDKLDINLRIGENDLHLTIKPEEEFHLRAAAREVNHAYDEFKKRFGSSKPQEVLAKVTLLFAQGYLSANRRANELNELLESFEKKLDELLD